MSEEKLNQLRNKIDQLDQELLEIISARALCASQVGKLKREMDSENAQYYRPEREANVLRRIAEHNQGPLADEEMARLFREVMSACLALERTLNIAYLGPEGTYTEEAALKHFGNSVCTTAQTSIDEVFREVESGAAQYGVVPIENSTEGVITHTLDNFMRLSLRIVGEVELRIHHHLMSMQKSMADLKTVYSHEQSLAQCRNWLNSNLVNRDRVSVGSNAQAAILACEQSDTAAIASRAAASRYGLNILASNIEDMSENSTRFLIVGKGSVGPSGADKTTLLVSAANESGSLCKLLQPFANHGVSLTRIESRPSHNANWEYVFFLDLDGHIEDPSLVKAVKELQTVATMVNVLGSYPKAVI